MQTIYNNPKNMTRKINYVHASNCKAVISLFRSGENMTIPKISKTLNLSIPTVTKIINQLLEKEMIISLGKGVSTEEGGKRPEIYTFNAEHKYVMVIMEDNMCVLFNMRTEPIFQIKGPRFHNITYDEVIERLMELSNDILEGAQVKLQQLLGIVCNIPGIVDEENGIILHTTWGEKVGSNLPLSADLYKALDEKVPVIITNGVRMAGYAELNGKAGQKYNTYVSLYSNPQIAGIGGCVVLNGKILRGKSGYIGEFGHMVVERNSKIKCVCGNEGCLETLVSPQTVLGLAEECAEDFKESGLAVKAKDGTLEFVELFRGADEGDGFAKHLIDYMVPYYGTAIRNIILSYDPQAIIMQGLPLTKESYMIKELQKYVHSLPFFGINPGAEIIPSEEYSAGMELEPGLEKVYIGGALFACNNYYNNSQLFI